MKSSKILLYTFTCICVAALCFCGAGSALVFRNFTAGVNPFREIVLATLGESIEIKESRDAKGKLHRQLLIDTIVRGDQFQPVGPLVGGAGNQPDWTRMPTTYFHPAGPVGVATSKFNWFPMQNDFLHAGDARLAGSLIAMNALAATCGPWSMLAAIWSEPPVGVLMMNDGTLAAYARSFQFVDFYERDPRIVQLSIPNDGGVPKFTYVDDAKKRGAAIRVFQGDERKTFDKESPKGFYHLLFVDTSHGHPGVPSKELLTMEAMQSQMNSIVEDGILCFHTSSRDYRLADVVAAVSSHLQLAHLQLHDGISDRESGHYNSEWVAVARKAETLRFMKNAAMLRNQNPQKRPRENFTADQLPVRPGLLWTDGGSNSLIPIRR